MIRKLLLAAALALGFTAPALAVDTSTSIGNANYTALPTDTTLVPTVALTANRTVTLPFAGATCIGQTCGASAFQIIDSQGNVGGSNSCIIVAPASGDTINNSTNTQTFCSTYGRVILFPLTGTNWKYEVLGPGQVQGTSTNDNAQAGYVGEDIKSTCPSTATTATVTITIAAPGVITWTGHGFTSACPVVFTTSGSLPTGITSGTVYYIVPSSITTNTFQIATTLTNALAASPTAITTTGSQSGTQTGTSGATIATATAIDMTGVSLTAGDWDCRGVMSLVTASSFAATIYEQGLGPTAATIPTQGTMAANYHQTASDVQGALALDHFIGPARFSLASTTIEHFAVDDTFSAGSATAYGTVECRRVR